MSYSNLIQASLRSAGTGMLSLGKDSLKGAAEDELTGEMKSAFSSLFGGGSNPKGISSVMQSLGGSAGNTAQPQSPAAAPGAAASSGAAASGDMSQLMQQIEQQLATIEQEIQEWLQSMSGESSDGGGAGAAGSAGGSGQASGSGPAGGAGADAGAAQPAGPPSISGALDQLMSDVSSGAGADTINQDAANVSAAETANGVQLNDVNSAMNGMNAGKSSYSQSGTLSALESAAAKDNVQPSSGSCGTGATVVQAYNQLMWDVSATGTSQQTLQQDAANLQSAENAAGVQLKSTNAAVSGMLNSLNNGSYSQSATISALNSGSNNDGMTGQIASSSNGSGISDSTQLSSYTPSQQATIAGDSTDLPSADEQAPPGMTADQIKQLDNGLLGNCGNQNMQGQGGQLDLLAKQCGGTDASSLDDPNVAWRAYKTLVAFKNEKEADGTTSVGQDVSHDGKVDGWSSDGDAIRGTNAGDLQDYLLHGRAPSNLQQSQNGGQWANADGTETSGAHVFFNSPGFKTFEKIVMPIAMVGLAFIPGVGEAADAALAGGEAAAIGADAAGEAAGAAGEAAGAAGDAAGEAAGSAGSTAGSAAGDTGDAAGEAGEVAGDSAGTTGSTTASSAGDAAGEVAGDAAGDAAGSSFSSAIRNTLSKFTDQITSQLKDPAALRNLAGQIKDKLVDQIKDQLKDMVKDQIKQQIENALGGPNQSTSGAPTSTASAAPPPSIGTVMSNANQTMQLLGELQQMLSQMTGAAPAAAVPAGSPASAPPAATPGTGSVTIGTVMSNASQTLQLMAQLQQMLGQMTPPAGGAPLQAALPVQRTAA